MTLQEAKDQVARKAGLDSWDRMRPIYQERYFDEVAELYARSKWDQACEYYENNTPILPARKPEYSKLIDWN